MQRKSIVSRLFLKQMGYNKGLLKVWWKQSDGRGGEGNSRNSMSLQKSIHPLIRQRGGRCSWESFMKQKCLNNECFKLLAHVKPDLG